MSTHRFEHQHGTDINVVRACSNPGAPDLVAIGGEHSVEVVQISEDSCTVLASFYIGIRVTAVAWSPRTTSPSQTEGWSLELAAAGEDLNLRLLNKYHDEEDEQIFVFGGGLGGHRKKINDLTWCGGFGGDSYRYLASVSDEKVLLFWDLSTGEQSPPVSPSPTPINAVSQPKPRSLSPAERPQPVPFAVPYAHPLHSVVSHPSTSKELVVSDAQGSVFVVDWRVDDDDDTDGDQYRGLSIAQLIDPRALADARTGMQTTWGGSVSWQQQDVNLIGAAYGSRWAIWDMRRLQGGKPAATGQAFPHGTHRFRWCPTTPDLFALSSHSPLEDAAIHVHNTSYMQSVPRRIVVRSRPHRIKDFDWLCVPKPAFPRLVAAIGRSIVVVDLGSDIDEAGSEN
ncbi:WD40-repeat-containing domain protein [Hysterangium stoloniferum]|nr:WD40-repeat-containing domain protein [Hysterangium stoloniferum]